MGDQVFAVDQAVGAVPIKAMHPVPQRLPIHAADPRRILAAHPIVDRRRTWSASFTP